jgi:hypothetical protein
MCVILGVILLLFGLTVIGGFPFWIWRQVRQHPNNSAHVIRSKLVGGLIGGLVILGCYQVFSWASFWWYLEDKTSIDIRYQEFTEARAEGRFRDAIMIMSPDYRKQNSLAQFETEFSQDSIFQLYPNRSLSVFAGRAELYPNHNTYTGFWSGPIYKWKKVGGEWYLTGEMDWSLD